MERQLGPDGLDVGHGGTPGGVPVVFVHGAMDRGAAFLRVTRLLADTSWWVYDRRGYGRSVEGGTTDIQGHVCDLVGVLERVSVVDGRRPVVVGHSVGGAVALAATEQRPDLVESLLVYEAAMSWMPWATHAIAEVTAGSPEQAAERFLRRHLGDEGWESMSPPSRDRRRAEGRALVAELSSAGRTPLFTPAAIERPVVVAHGSDAPERAVLAADAMLADLPHARRVVVQGTPHGAHLSHPMEIAALVRGMLDGTLLPGPAPSGLPSSHSEPTP
jgi:pimeloyl-ACP methyl ester carboxylesterase